MAKATQFTAHAIGDPPKPHVTIFDPELSIHCATFMGLRRQLTVVFYWSIPMLKQSSQNRPPKWRFFGNL